MATEWKSETVPLAYPINGKGESAQKITSITLFEPNVEALETIQNLGLTENAEPTISQLRVVIGAVARIEPDLLLQLHRDDFQTLQEKTVPFVTGSKKPETPENSTSSESTTS